MFLFREFILSEKKEIRASIKQIYGVGWLKANLIINKLGLYNPYYGNNLNNYYTILLIYLLKGYILSDSKIKRFLVQFGKKINHKDNSAYILYIYSTNE